MLVEKSFLIVDDDTDDRYFIVRAITKINPAYCCSTAIHGLDALKKLKAMQPLPDYIFLDFNMPKMNGLDCLEAIKANALLRHIPVIMYSTSTYQRDIDLAHAYGAAHYLPKPLDIQLLPDLIIEALQRVDNAVL